MTTNWVLTRQCLGFPLMYHWRILPGPPAQGPPGAEHADVERAVAYWEGCREVRERLLAMAHSSASVVVFMEYFPRTLHEWLGEKISRGGDAAESACLMADRNLQAMTSLMNSRGLLHFDAHFNNILTDGQRLYFTDFGLAMYARFDLSGVEARFLASHRSYDRSYTVTHLVTWLKAAQGLAAGNDPITSEYAGREEPACLPAAADAIVGRYTPIAGIVGDFHRRLTEDKLTSFRPMRSSGPARRPACRMTGSASVYPASGRRIIPVLPLLGAVSPGQIPAKRLRGSLALRYDEPRLLRSVDVEFVAFRVLHPDRVVVQPFLRQRTSDGGAQAGQTAGLRVDSLPASLDRVRPLATGVDVEVQPVLDRLGIRDDMEPDARPVALRVADPVRSVGQFLLGHPQLAIEVVPGSESTRGRREFIAQRGGPEAGEPVRISTVDDQLKADRHGFLPKPLR